MKYFRFTDSKTYIDYVPEDRVRQISFHFNKKEVVFYIEDGVRYVKANDINDTENAFEKDLHSFLKAETNNMIFDVGNYQPKSKELNFIEKGIQIPRGPEGRSA